MCWLSSYAETCHMPFQAEFASANVVRWILDFTVDCQPWQGTPAVVPAHALQVYGQALGITQGYCFKFKMAKHVAVTEGVAASWFLHGRIMSMCGQCCRRCLCKPPQAHPPPKWTWFKVIPPAPPQPKCPQHVCVQLHKSTHRPRYVSESKMMISECDSSRF